MKKIMFLIFLLCFAYELFAKGNLVIIGGGEVPDRIMNKIIELAGGKSANILILPMASAEPIETAESRLKQFIELGALNSSFVLISKDNADEDSILQKFNGVTGVFFSGGDQNRLTKALLGTKSLEMIKKIYINGGVISGTSAGAAVMSEIMITGDELRYENTSQAFATIETSNIKTAPGFGFINSAIIDQHFVFRKRHNRLISLVLENNKIGIGIDESTAIIVDPDDVFEVAGDRHVIVYDAATNTNVKKNDRGLLSAENIIMHVLFEGEKFNMKTNTAIR